MNNSIITKQGDFRCKHRWSPYIRSLNSPPTYFYECERCGRIEARTDGREPKKEVK